MRPILFDSVRAYPVFIAVAVVVGALITLHSAKQAGVALHHVLKPLLVITVAAILGAKLASVLERAGTVHSLHWELSHGYRYPGGVIGSAIVILLSGRLWSPSLSFWAFADLLAPATAFSAGAVRIGCLLVGCCAGTVSDLPWAVRFPPESEVWQHQVAQGLIANTATRTSGVHPLQLYFFVLSVGVGAFLLWLRRRKSYDGQVVLAFLVLHETGKFLLEFLREEHLPYLRLVSLGLAGLALGALLGNHSRDPG